MGIQYNADQLLRLRESALVCKPAGLPPAQEWMGPPAERSAAKPTLTRAKPEDHPSHNDNSGRRPSLFETKNVSRSSATVPGDIVLGPPKTSFASATAGRGLSKTAATSNRSMSSPMEDEATRAERYNFRNKFFKDRDREVPNGERAGESKTGIVNGRRGYKEEADGWTSVKPRKSFGHEDADRFHRRDTEKERDLDRNAGKGFKDRPQSRPFDGVNRADKERETDRDAAAPRRNGVPRGRNEATWFRDNDASAAKEKHGNQDNTREKEWREKERPAEREWTSGRRGEKDPEWMDTPAKDEKKQIHTAEDFQRWKERMKAGQSVDEGKGETADEQQVARAKPPEPPLIVKGGMDNFFGLWNDASPSLDTPGEAASAKDQSKMMGKASRFTSFFNPQEELPQPTARPPPENDNQSRRPPDSSSEDKEGFQRILQMLGGVGMDSNQSAQLTEAVKQQAELGGAPQARAAPSGEGPDVRRQASHQQILRPQHAGPEDTFSPQPTPGNAPQSRNNEFLFSLMQQQQAKSNPDLTAQHQSPLNQFPPGLTGEELYHRTQGVHPNFMIPTKRGRELNGPPPGFFDEMQRRPNESAVGQNVNQQALQRPPGFDQFPPAWAGNPHLPPPPPQQQQQRGMAPPPGLNVENARGMPYQTFMGPPPNMPPFPAMQPGRVPLGPGLNGIGMPPNAPPNMPPPGFFGMNGPPPPPPPPPGYPPMGYHDAAMMRGPGPGSGPGGVSGAGVGVGPGMGPSPNLHSQQRPGVGAPFDLFLEGGGGNANGSGGGSMIRGAGEVPGQSRR
ncbi:MAG: hypothetical protein M1825_004389 [Sarcosagium campestre]|nr:MAG: hypothetical protein M1825_004389 [Sarcosagium campestre]